MRETDPHILNWTCLGEIWRINIFGQKFKIFNNPSRCQFRIMTTCYRYQARKYNLSLVDVLRLKRRKRFSRQTFILMFELAAWDFDWKYLVSFVWIFLFYSKAKIVCTLRFVVRLVVSLQIGPIISKKKIMVQNLATWLFIYKKLVSFRDTPNLQPRLICSC